MAPGTNIGAAHPVGLQGGEKDSIMNEKATNDAAAFIRSISEKRHRNIRWAENAVRHSTALSETEALRDSVVDVIAPTVAALMDSVDGRTVDVNGTATVLRTRNPRIVEVGMGWNHQILNILSDPNIAYIFFLLGLYGLLFELYNPGAYLPGVVGVIAIILALLIAPLATELPEMSNSFLWLYQKKDRLAVGNVTGAMVFQGMFPVSIRLLGTDWTLAPSALITMVLAVLAAGGLLIQTAWAGQWRPWLLSAGAVLYIGYALYLYGS